MIKFSERRIQTSVRIICTSLVLVCGTIAHADSGSIVAWGLNSQDQCNVPAPNMDFLAVTGGWRHSLGLKSDGSIVAWGYNNSGQCDVPDPNTDFIAVSAGFSHSLGLKSDGSIVAWGSNSYGECDVPDPNTDFIAVSAGWSHTIGLKSDGSIVAWGYNGSGQCDVPDPNTDFIAVSAGSAHSLGVKSDGSIVAWGYNYYGQCDVPAPNSEFVAIAGGYSHSLGLKSDGSIVAWGRNNKGQCDIPTPNESFVAVTAGFYHSLGLKSDGSIVAWGWNSHGQCYVPDPNKGFTAIEGGNEHSLGLKGVNHGACCIEGEPCQFITQKDCDLVLGGTYQGDGVNCNPNPCLGACCLNGIECVDAVTQFDCKTIFGGLWRGSDTSCASVNCAEVYKLLADEGMEGDVFGRSVSISGDTAVIGAPSMYICSAYVFQKIGSDWEQVAKLLPSDWAGYSFGQPVFISGNTIVVGAWATDGGGPGSAYVYIKPVEGWSGTIYESAQLHPSDGETDDTFGYSVSITPHDYWDEVIVVGAPDSFNNDTSGSAYIFNRPSGGWSGNLSEDGKLLPSDGVPGDSFGSSVSTSGGDALFTTIVVGAGEDDDNGDSSGSAYVFYNIFMQGWTYNENAKLLPSDGTEDDGFGYSISTLDGDTVVVGASGDDDNGFSSGSAYVFQMPVSGWSGILNEEAKLLASDGATDDAFGHPVSISGDTVVVGALLDDDNGFNSGSAYVFQMPVGGWSGILNEEAKLLASDGAVGDLFGYSVSIFGDKVVVGAPSDDDNGTNSGSTYVFDVSAITCPADLTGDDQVNIDDVFAALGLWGDCDDPCPPYCDGDLTEDCIVNIDDIFAILGEWGPCE